MVHWSHPMFLGYFGWTTTAPGILGEILSAPLNVNAMTWRTCPAATELETVVIDWLRQWVGLPNEFDGVVYDTASVGIMHAMAAAREEAAPSVRKRGLAGRADLPRFRIYTSDQAHNAAEKAAIALGIGEENVRRVPSDDEFRMDLPVLRERLRQIGNQVSSRWRSSRRLEPLQPPASILIAEMANLCREEKMWLHIDAAYGGGFAIVPEYKWITEGWSAADSIIINPHKSLFVPLDFSVLFCARSGALAPCLLARAAGLFARRYRGGEKKLHGLRHPARTQIPRTQSVGDLAVVRPRGNRCAPAGANPSGKFARQLDQRGQPFRAIRAGQHGRSVLSLYSRHP